LDTSIHLPPRGLTALSAIQLWSLIAIKIMNFVLNIYDHLGNEKKNDDKKINLLIAVRIALVYFHRPSDCQHFG
jgi:hypothetical protein